MRSALISSGCCLTFSSILASSVLQQESESLKAIDVLQNRLVFFSGQQVYSGSDNDAFPTSLVEVLDSNYNIVILESTNSKKIPVGAYKAWFNSNFRDVVKNKFKKENAKLGITCGDESDNFNTLAENDFKSALDLGEFCGTQVPALAGDFVNVRLNLGDFRNSISSFKIDQMVGVLDAVLKGLMEKKVEVYWTFDEQDLDLPDEQNGNENGAKYVRKWILDNQTNLKGVIIRYVNTNTDTLQGHKFANIFGVQNPNSQTSKIYYQSLSYLHDVGIQTGKIIPVKIQTDQEPASTYDIKGDYLQGFIPWDQLIEKFTIPGQYAPSFNGVGLWSARVNRPGDVQASLPNNLEDVNAIGESFASIAVWEWPCQDELCESCETGPSKCDECVSGAEQNSTEVCNYHCDEVLHCGHCSAVNVCDACEEGYTLDLKENICKIECEVKNCETGKCNDVNKCYDCKVNYVLDKNFQCEQSSCSGIKHCKTCDETVDGKLCTECDLSQMSPNSEGQCDQRCNVNNCNNCMPGNDLICENCDYDYHLVSGGECKIDCKVSHCLSCVSGYGDFCEICAEGYELSADSKECVIPSKCGEHCLDCFDSSPFFLPECVMCEEGYGKMDNFCAECSVDNCEMCYEDYEECQKCADGFKLKHNECSNTERLGSGKVFVLVGLVLVGIFM